MCPKDVDGMAVYTLIRLPLELHDCMANSVDPGQTASREV